MDKPLSVNDGGRLDLGISLIGLIVEQCAEIAEQERDMWDPDHYSYKACDKIVRRIRGLMTAAQQASK